MVAEFVPEATPEMAHKKMNPTESAEVIQILSVARLKVIQMKFPVCLLEVVCSDGMAEGSSLSSLRPSP